MSETKSSSSYIEFIVRTLLSAVIVSGFSWFSVQSSVKNALENEQIIQGKNIEANTIAIKRHDQEHKEDMKMIAARYVEKNVFAPIKEQTIENKNRIDQVKEDISYLKAKTN